MKLIYRVIFQLFLTYMTYKSRLLFLTFVVHRKEKSLILLQGQGYFKHTRLDYDSEHCRSDNYFEFCLVTNLNLWEQELLLRLFLSDNITQLPKSSVRNLFNEVWSFICSEPLCVFQHYLDKTFNYLKNKIGLMYGMYWTRRRIKGRPIHSL